MIQRIVAYRTKHFEFRVPVDEWNEKKIPLPEGAGAQFIAPSDLTAILLEPFYYDWNYETDGRMTDGPTLVYDEEWVGKEIRHFPWCKELLEFLDCLKKQYGWTMTESWKPIADRLLATGILRRRSVIASEVFGLNEPFALQRIFGLAFSGCVLLGDLQDVGSCGYFWSAYDDWWADARCLSFDYDSVGPAGWLRRNFALSVRCVSESGSFPNS